MDAKRGSVDKRFLLIVNTVDVVFLLDSFIVDSILHVLMEFFSKDFVAGVNIRSYTSMPCSLTAYKGEKKQCFTAAEIREIAVVSKLG